MGPREGRSYLPTSAPAHTMRRLALGVTSALLLFPALLLAGWLGGCREEFDRQQELLRLYEVHYRENREACDRFKHTADARGWKFWAWDGTQSLGVFDLARCIYAPAYSAPAGYSLSGASRRRAGRIALVESKRQTPWRRNPGTADVSRLVILGPQGSVTKVDLPAAFYLPSIALGVHSVVVGAARDAYLYLNNADAIQKVFSTADWVISKVDLVEPEFVVILLYRQAISRLVVLAAEEPYHQVSAFGDLSNFTVVGQKLIVEKRGACFLYDPRGGTSERLAEGHLLFASGMDTFLFCVMDEGNPHFGRGGLHRYRISARRKELLWEPQPPGPGARESESRFYDYHELIISPDASFLFMSFRHVSPPMIWWREYDVYHLPDGKKLGAFFGPFEGGRVLDFLGWAETEEAPVRFDDNTSSE